jgi:hypothetical protein
MSVAVCNWKWFTFVSLISCGLKSTKGHGVVGRPVKAKPSAVNTGHSFHSRIFIRFLWVYGVEQVVKPSTGTFNLCPPADLRFYTGDLEAAIGNKHNCWLVAFANVSVVL